METRIANDTQVGFGTISVYAKFTSITLATSLAPMYMGLPG